MTIQQGSRIISLVSRCYHKHREIIPRQQFTKTLNTLNAINKLVDRIDYSALERIQNLTDLVADIKAVYLGSKKSEVEIRAVVVAQFKELEERNLNPLLAKCARRIFETLDAINREKRIFEGQVRAYKLQYQALHEKSFSSEQIAQIIQPVDKDAHDFKIAALEAEHKAMQAFTDDYPRYDESIIAAYME